MKVGMIADHEERTCCISVPFSSFFRRTFRMATPPAAAIGAGNAIVGLCLKLCRATHSVKYQPSSLAPSTAYDRPNIEKQPFFFAVSFYLLAVLTEALGEIG